MAKDLNNRDLRDEQNEEKNQEFTRNHENRESRNANGNTADDLRDLNSEEHSSKLNPDDEKSDHNQDINYNRPGVSRHSTRDRTPGTFTDNNPARDRNG